jgi:hypothetical protein
VLEIRESNVPLDKLIVQCVEGCNEVKNYTVGKNKRVGPLRVPSGEHGWKVTLHIKYEGYDKGIEVKHLEPGTNPLNVKLKEL